MNRPSWLLRALAAIPLSLALAAAAPAQTRYPDKPLRIIVPYPAGISPDVVARILGDKLAQSWGQPVVVDNRPGASGMIGAELAAKSPADGYTMLIAVSAVMSMNPHLYSKMTYDPIKDFKPVTHVLNVPFVLTASMNTPYNTIPELVDAAKKEPGKINYATLGAGSHSHVAMEWFMNATQTRMTHVPYKGSPLTDLVSGAVSLYLDPVVTAQPQVAGQKIKALGVSSGKRSPLMPNVPAISETVPGFETYAFQGIYVPADTPDDIVAKLSAELVRIVRLPDVQKKLTDFGYIPVAGSSADLAKLTRDDYALWGKIIRDNNIRLD
ncbi:MAG: tripartite tricarboxylate transporter substrate binding protein [Variovorax sp.]